MIGFVYRKEGAVAASHGYFCRAHRSQALAIRYRSCRKEIHTSLYAHMGDAIVRRCSSRTTVPERGTLYPMMRCIRIVVVLTISLASSPPIWAQAPLVLATPEGLFVAIDAFPGAVSVAGERLWLRGPTSTLEIPAWIQSSAGCPGQWRSIDNVRYLSANAVACAGLPMPMVPPFLSFTTQPLLDMRLEPTPGKLRVVIDAGHGGHDTGASAYGVIEKEITLRLAWALRDQLSARNFEVFMTRDTDRYLTLRERAEIANRLHADLFVSLHCNAGRRPGARGIELFIASRHADDAETAVLAERENAGELTWEIDETDAGIVLADLAVQDQLQHSAHVAAALLAGLAADAKVENRGVKRAPFWVLLGANMPAVLVEAGFVTNTEESRLLADPNHQKRLAGAMAGSLAGVQDVLLARRARSSHARNIAERRTEPAPAETHPELASPR